MKKRLLTISALLLLSASNTLFAKDVYVSSESALQKAIKAAVAGDNLILKNGTYTDINIVFYGEGTEDKPITLKAETPGKVFIEGLSDLKLGGTYLNVDGLYFRNGYTPSSSVINFRIDEERIAFHSKVTNSVIDEFTQKDREARDWWVEFWGQHNELSHSYLAGKSNRGPTVKVQLGGNQHINNHHQIVNNHFGPRPRKGGPSAETMQLGSSSTSMTPSYTNIENNLFDRCNGEVEVISSKSNYNQFKNNVFFQSEGSLVLRHGNYATIDGNLFIGDGSNEFVGGIRVINTGHWITNNYFYKLTGEKFRAPIAVMNGIPKSPLNRYNQVTDVVVAYNSWVDSPTPWYFSVGSNVEQSDVLPKSEIRSARPTRTLFANNLIYNSAKAEQPIHAYDKVDGITFKANISNHANKSGIGEDGISQQKMTLAGQSDYLKAPTATLAKPYHGFDFDKIDTDLLGNKRANNNNIGAISNTAAISDKPFDESRFGPSWFEAEQPAAAPSTHKAATANELVQAIKAAQSGDTIELSAASYALSQSISIDKQVRITSANKNKPATLSFSASNTAFLMQPKGDLTLDSVTIQGNGKQHAFATLDKYMSKAYNLSIINAKIANFKHVLEVSMGSFADNIEVVNTRIENCQSGFMLNKETKNKGTYNAEYLVIKNSSFDRIDGAIVDFHRGGYDESTIGGILVFENNTVTNSGKARADKVLMKNHGIVNVTFEGNTFNNNPVDVIAILWGEKGQKPVGNTIKNSGKIKVVDNLKLDLLY
ncbi:alginate lyase [Neiella marina]|uniref:Alginate lyase n=1 Tax=Neiella holothuriorum TaxID=2870530 RepID=A0ABS7EMJ9_9GAMM|nr:chondroitinase-B domain-containing protein [Neiella holothuriorum]MBW8192892.1 alginate lyase [Neiella holothuriorum]